MFYLATVKAEYKCQLWLCYTYLKEWVSSSIFPPRSTQDYIKQDSYPTFQYLSFSGKNFTKIRVNQVQNLFTIVRDLHLEL